MNRNFLIKWIFATALGISVGVLSGAWISGTIESYTRNVAYPWQTGDFLWFVEKTILSNIWSITIGVFLGIAQWAVLRGHVANASRWIWATIAGSITWSFVYFLDLSTNMLRFYNSWVGMVLICAMTGVSLGVAQSWVLGRSKIWCWVLANLVGIVGFLHVGFVGGFLIMAFIHSFEQLGFMGRVNFVLTPRVIIGSATFGSITGIALIRLLKD